MKFFQTLLLVTTLVAPSVAQADFANGSYSANVIPPTSNDAQFYSLIPGVPSVSAAALLQNTARCAPYVPPGIPPGSIPLQHFDQLGMTVTTLGTGPINVALYTDAIDATTHRHQPQLPIATGSFTVTAVATVTAAMGTAGTGVPISGGLDWVCVNDANAADLVRYSTYTTLNIANLIGSSTASNVTSSANNITSLTVAQTAGTWPSFVGVGFTDNIGAVMPQISARVASVP